MVVSLLCSMYVVNMMMVGGLLFPSGRAAEAAVKLMWSKTGVYTM